jgi:hypothetical protein
MPSQWVLRMILLLIAVCVFPNRAEQYVNDDGEKDDEAIVEEYVNEYNSKYDSNAGYVDGNGEIMYWTDLAMLPKRCIA